MIDNMSLRARLVYGALLLVPGLVHAALVVGGVSCLAFSLASFRRNGVDLAGHVVAGSHQSEQNGEKPGRTCVPSGTGCP